MWMRFPAIWSANPIAQKATIITTTAQSKPNIVYLQMLHVKSYTLFKYQELHFLHLLLVNADWQKKNKPPVVTGG
jgi:hypothetical protein